MLSTGENLAQTQWAEDDLCLIVGSHFTGFIMMDQREARDHHLSRPHLLDLFRVLIRCHRCHLRNLYPINLGGGQLNLSLCSTLSRELGWIHRRQTTALGLIHRYVKETRHLLTLRHLIYHLSLIRLFQ